MTVHFLTVLSSKGRVFVPFPRDQGRIRTVSARVAEERPSNVEGREASALSTRTLVVLDPYVTM